jgi:hypothetical protein
MWQCLRVWRATLMPAVVMACATGPTVEDVCDGSDDVRLYVGEWAAGAANLAVDYVMYAEGVRYLKVDGQCRYFAYEGEAVEYRWWEAVREGTLSHEEMGEVLERLSVDKWDSFDEEDLIWPSAQHAEWDRFHVAGAEYDCPYGCSPEGDAIQIVEEERRVIEELFERGDAVVPLNLELALLAEPKPETSSLPLNVEWGAEVPLDDVVDDPAGVLISGDPDDIGTFVAAADEPWFVEVRQQYLAAAPIGGPSTIGILDDVTGEVAYNLYVRMVVP